MRALRLIGEAPPAAVAASSAAARDATSHLDSHLEPIGAGAPGAGEAAGVGVGVRALHRIGGNDEDKAAAVEAPLLPHEEWRAWLVAERGSEALHGAVYRMRERMHGLVADEADGAKPRPPHSPIVAVAPVLRSAAAEERASRAAQLQLLRRRSHPAEDDDDDEAEADGVTVDVPSSPVKAAPAAAAAGPGLGALLGSMHIRFDDLRDWAAEEDGPQEGQEDGPQEGPLDDDESLRETWRQLRPWHRAGAGAVF